jgi:ribonucleoside-diphosphate reductase alpha subunit
MASFASMRFVTKRDGSHAPICFDKITNRIEKLRLMSPSLDNICSDDIAQRVIANITDGISTTTLDTVSADIAYNRAYINMQNAHMATRIAVSNMHKNTPATFSDAIEGMYYRHDTTGARIPSVSEETYNFVQKYKTELDAAIQYQNDYSLNYMAVQIFDRMFLTRSCDGKCIEGIQHLLMRVSVGLYSSSAATREELATVLRAYKCMSQRRYTHATPTLFASGTPNNQMLSCFLFKVKDSILGMYDALRDAAVIAKNAGGIGVHIHDIRERGATIRSNGRESTGFIPYLKTLSAMTEHVDQGRKRPASIAVYIELTHPDLMQFINMRRNISGAGNTSKEEDKARNLFPALWMSKLFFKRVKNNEIWSLFHVMRSAHLFDLYGDAYEQEYLRLEQDPQNISSQLPAVDVLYAIASSMIECGLPYLCHKDHTNEKSNYQHYGTIKSSNLCTEIMEYSDEKEYACCTLGSVAVRMHLQPFDKSFISRIVILSKDNCQYCTYSKNLLEAHGLEYTEIKCNTSYEKARAFARFQNECNCLEDCKQCGLAGSIEKAYGTFPQIIVNDQHIGGFTELFKFIRPSVNYQEIMDSVGSLVYGLNQVIDKNDYPLEQTRVSNMRHRPIGIGVQGLADLFSSLRIPYDSPEASRVNKAVFACMYYAACKASMELAKRDGPYETFAGSPMSKGLFQFDMWKQSPLVNVSAEEYFGHEDIHLDWDTLRKDIMTHGIRNAQLIALMPTATTSSIMGQNDCFEAYSNIIYKKNTFGTGDIMHYIYMFMEDMRNVGAWKEDMYNRILENDGSIQQLTDIPEVIRSIYKTVWDISCKVCMTMAAERGPYCCGSQSQNHHLLSANIAKVTSLICYGDAIGLKTISYYMRTRGASQMQKFSLATTSMNTSAAAPEVSCESCSG